ncbi:MAG: hypothetical protein ABI128_07030 [Rhodanobacter sp.]
MRISIPDSDLHYYLVSFDKTGVERDESAGPQSDELKRLLADDSEAITDVFFAVHGWKGDIPAAIDQCNRWMGQMALMQKDRAAIRARVPQFKALLVGIHWPSQPWGEESLEDTASESGLLGGDEVSAALVDHYAEAISQTPAAREAIETILTGASSGQRRPRLSPEIVEAYDTLLKEAELWSDEDADDSPLQTQWDAQSVYADARESGDDSLLLGGNFKDAFLSPLRQISFWTMKARARVVGEIGVGKLLRDLQVASGSAVRFHLMGHSFGCIVVSGAIAGAAGAPLVRPVDSALLVQGALSLWSYGQVADDKPGYFQSIVTEKRVRGPIVTTWSTHDGAVGNLYPMAARLGRQDTLANYPKFGGVGAYGLQGAGKFAHEIIIGDAAAEYGWQPGQIYNVESSRIIANGDGLSGAHSDIAHPEVAHVAWQAVKSSVG